MKTPELLAEEHITWFLETIKPLLITFFIHGHGHGMEDESKKDAKTRVVIE